MIKLININELSDAQLQYRLQSLAVHFQDVNGKNNANWKAFVDTYDPPLTSKINKAINEIQQILNDLNENVSDSTKFNRQYIEVAIGELNTTVNKLPPEIRGHVENVLKEESKKLGLNLVQSDTPNSNHEVVGKEGHASDEPLVIHLAGTEVKVTNTGDPLAYWARQQRNFYIRGGVSDRYHGEGGEENIQAAFDHIQKIFNPAPPATAPRNKCIVLTGFSRGAAAQIALANEIHNKLNDGKSKDQWVKIEMLLVDPAFGAVDSTRAATRTHNIPPCVNTLNILYSDPKAKLESWFHRYMTRHTRDRLKSDPAHTTIQTLNLQGNHNAVGLFDLVLGRGKSSYFVEAVCRNFLSTAGKTEEQSKNQEIPKLNTEYIKKNVIATTPTTAMQYYSAYTKRAESTMSQTDANAVKFSESLKQYSSGDPTQTPQNDQYHNLLMQMYGAMIEGDYKTTFSGLEHGERAKSKMPKHMFKMCQEIETYCTKLNDGKSVSAEDTFKAVQKIAGEAQKNEGLFSLRQSNVREFYKEVAKPNTDGGAPNIDTAVSQIKGPKPGG